MSPLFRAAGCHGSFCLKLSGIHSVGFRFGLALLFIEVDQRLDFPKSFVSEASLAFRALPWHSSIAAVIAFTPAPMGR
jgi:hypothetical protein